MFLDLASLLMKNEALNPALTFDGQHLNDAGYVLIASPLFQALSKACPTNF